MFDYEFFIKLDRTFPKANIEFGLSCDLPKWRGDKENIITICRMYPMLCSLRAAEYQAGGGMGCTEHTGITILELKGATVA